VTLLTLKIEKRFQPQLEEITKALRPFTKLVVLASPGNPTGVRVPQETIEALLKIIEDVTPGCYLVVDETYRDANYGKQKPPISPAILSPKVVCMNSLSKAMGAPGLRMGWLICRDTNLMKRLINAKRNLWVCNSPLDELLARKLTEKKAALMAPRQGFLNDALNLVERWVKAEELVHWVKPDAGAFCLLQLSTKVSKEAAESLVPRLLQQSALISPGSWFYGTERTFRLGFGYLSLADLQAGLGLLSHLLHEKPAHKK